VPHPAYDTAEGILRYLHDDLEGLERLSSDRRAAYQRKEPLNEFCVLGRFRLDTCGAFSPITENAPADLYRVNKYDENSRVPPVLTSEQLWIFMRGEHLVSSMQHPFAPAYAVCPLCNKGWRLANCHDIITGDLHEYVDISEFAGTPLKEVRQIPRLVGVAKHFVSSDQIGNANHKGARLRNDLPWRSVDKDYIVQEGDVVFVQILVYKHEACYRRDGAWRQRVEMEGVFTRAGFPKVNLVTIPNEYHGGQNGQKVPYYAAPWYLAQVGDGPVFKIGWRKSVININWQDSGMNLEHLFESEQVTKGPYLIHAHGYDKAVEYLAKIVPALEAP